MANYSNLKAAINAVIKQNGQGEITGEVMNQVLTAMVNSLGSNYMFAGVATPSTNPGTPDQNVFYMATQAGTYTNFNAIVLQAGISILLWNGSWSSETFFEIDSVPTSGSGNFISSGAVFDKFKLDGGAYDVSAHNNNQTFASLSALLSDANLSTLIPTNIRSGGMSIKFVQTSDNKYVQYRLIKDAWSTTVYDWQEEIGVGTAPKNDTLFVKDRNGNVILELQQGHIFTKNFNSIDIATKTALYALRDTLKVEIDTKQDAGQYVEYNSLSNTKDVYIADNNGNVAAVIKNGAIMTSDFNSNIIKNINLKFLSYDAAKNDTILMNRKCVPRISWIDDDMNTSDQAHIDCFTKLRTWANANSIRPDIALIPNYTFTDNTNTDLATVTFSTERLNLVKELEKEGFHFLLHPIHQGLYNNDWNSYISDAYANKNIAMCIRAFKEASIGGYNVLVYPGSSAAIPHNVAIARANFDYAITPWDTSKKASGVNIGIDHSRYELARYSLDRLNERTVAQMKEEIDTAISNKAWIIFISHCWNFSGNIDDPVTESGRTFANLFEVVSYANSKIPIMPTQQVWNERNIIWEHYTNNN